MMQHLTLYKEPTNTRGIYGYVAEALYDQQARTPYSTGWWAKWDWRRFKPTFFWNRRYYPDDVGEAFWRTLKRKRCPAARSDKGGTFSGPRRRGAWERDPKDWDRRLHLKGIQTLDALGRLGRANLHEQWVREHMTYAGWVDIDALYPDCVVDVKYRSNVQRWGVRMNFTTQGLVNQLARIGLTFQYTLLAEDGPRRDPTQYLNTAPTFLGHEVAPAEDMGEKTTEQGYDGRTVKFRKSFPIEMFQPIKVR